MRTAALLVVSAALLVVASCEREEREFRPEGTQDVERLNVPVTTLEPGSAQPSPVPELGEDFEENAYHMAEGKRLFAWFNCVGCHANGGGGMGPALLDDAWIYGGELTQIVATIRDGRPNGMPSFAAKIPDQQIWQIAAYVRSMGRYVRKDAAPARKDGMHARPAENRLPFSEPNLGGVVPPSAQVPQ